MELPFPRGLVVSCQAQPDEPLFGSAMMARMAAAAEAGGAVAIRANTPEDVRAIREAVSLPVIGIHKVVYPDSEVYITPTLAEVDALLAAGAQIVSLDATDRPRPEGAQLESLVSRIHAQGRLAMADIATLAEAERAERLGFDLVATTLSGYTAETRHRALPDLDLVADAARRLHVPLLAEGHVSTPADLVACLRRGAYAVVVGTAITRPQVITHRFVEAFSQWSKLAGARPR